MSCLIDLSVDPVCGILPSLQESAPPFGTEKLGVPPSDRLGKIQNALLQEVLDDPRRNNRDYLLSRARELMTIV